MMGNGREDWKEKNETEERRWREGRWREGRWMERGEMIDGERGDRRREGRGGEIKNWDEELCREMEQENVGSGSRTERDGRRRTRKEG